MKHSEPGRRKRRENIVTKTETMPFRDRSEAGQALAGKLSEYADRSDVLVLGLPRGGVPVACEVAQALHVPLDVFVVRKLGLPGQEELAMGAIASGGICVLNEDVVRILGISDEVIEKASREQQQELERRERMYRNHRPLLEVRGRTVILVDDGLATGSTMRAGVAALRRLRPKAIVVAVPVGAVESCEDLRAEADAVVCVRTPEPFRAVGLWYENFSQTTDDEVRNLLDKAAQEHAPV